MTDVERILSESSSVLLIDWPNTGVPRALLAAGFSVFGRSPSGFSVAELVEQKPEDFDSQAVFGPDIDGDTGFLVFRRLETPPDKVDVICIYRPEAEIEGIIKHTVEPLQPKLLWLQPPNVSSYARSWANQHGIAFVEGVAIDEAARQRRSAKHG